MLCPVELAFFSHVAYGGYVVRSDGVLGADTKV